MFFRRIDTDPFLKTYNNLCNDVTKTVNNISSGGCGIFALLLENKLSKLSYVSNITFKVWDPILPKRSISKVRKKVPFSERDKASSWCNKGIRLYHIIISFKYNNTIYYCDSSGIVDIRQYRRKVHRGALSLKELSAFVNDATIWNKLFNREDVPLLQNMIYTWVFPESVPNNTRLSYGEGICQILKNCLTALSSFWQNLMVILNIYLDTKTVKHLLGNRL